jgi:hypothetical protein
MRSFIWLGSAYALTISLTGCLYVDLSRQPKTPKVDCIMEGEPVPPAPAATTDTRLNARLDAARQIGNPFQKSKAMVKLAEDAADAGQAEIAKQCLAEIGDPFAQSKTSEHCALKLAHAGQEPAAVEMARKIGDPMRRDKVLQMVAKGDVED